jgi:hypothetical protein
MKGAEPKTIGACLAEQVIEVAVERATFDPIRLALDSTNPPSLSAIAKAERLSKQTVFRLKQDPQAALDAWGL